MYCYNFFVWLKTLSMGFVFSISSLVTLYGDDMIRGAYNINRFIYRDF